VRIERAGAASFQVTLHAYELAALASAARWVVEGSEGELADEARVQLRHVLAQYDQQLQRLAANDR
jgi:imidazolonepropionase-like amidohydrolase